MQGQAKPDRATKFNSAAGLFGQGVGDQGPVFIGVDALQGDENAPDGKHNQGYNNEDDFLEDFHIRTPAARQAADRSLSRVKRR
jgi:hypothetical protein